MSEAFPFILDKPPAPTPPRSSGSTKTILLGYGGRRPQHKSIQSVQHRHTTKDVSAAKPVCRCEPTKNCVKRTVRKMGPNKGRQFWTCQTGACKQFLWHPIEQKEYRQGTCDRCGRYSKANPSAECNSLTCTQTHDYFGAPI